MSKDRISIDPRLDIVEIFTLIDTLEESVITLEIGDSGVFQSSFALRLLVDRFPSKKFQIVSSDPSMKRLAERIGIRVYPKVESIEFEQEYSKIHVLRHNFTSMEYLWYEIKKSISKLKYQARKKKSPTLKYHQGWMVETNLVLLISGLILSVSLLAFIFYFAVSKTYVYITPDFAVKTVSQNLLYSENEAESVLDTRPIIAVERIEKTVQIDEIFNISTYDIASVRAARGEVEVYNELSTEQIFRPNSRFVTPDGLLYRSQEWIKIPPTRMNGEEVAIGKVKTILIADGYDTTGELIGERGNIKTDTILDIPGLKFNRDKFYAKVTSNFTGGQNPTLKLITEDELNRSQSILADKVKRQALEQLKSDIRQKNSISGKNLEVLDVPETIKYSEPKLEILDGAKVGDRRSEVHIRATVTITSYVYNKDTALSYLRALMNERLLFGTERLHEILPDSLKITTILNRADAPKFMLRGTTELSATISYNFEDDANAQTKRLKNLIAGLTSEQSLSILQADKSIANAKIRLSPFWLTRVSSNIDNIKFIIEK
ncbi:MAG: hypothetical protein PHU93_04295 [Candidatus Gracilibacteria bacterium]|nr:hypothetical protein [Candidatus Gracilibacteria bacterium]